MYKRQVLGKSNKINPKKLAEKLRELFLDQIKNFSNVEIAGPGFLNIKLSKSALIENMNLILIYRAILQWFWVNQIS